MSESFKAVFPDNQGPLGGLNMTKLFKTSIKVIKTTNQDIWNHSITVFVFFEEWIYEVA